MPYLLHDLIPKGTEIDIRHSYRPIHQNSTYVAVTHIHPYDWMESSKIIMLCDGFMISKCHLGMHIQHQPIQSNYFVIIDSTRLSFVLWWNITSNFLVNFFPNYKKNPYLTLSECIMVCMCGLWKKGLQTNIYSCLFEFSAKATEIQVNKKHFQKNVFRQEKIAFMHPNICVWAK